MRQTKLNKNCSLYKKIYFLKIFRLYITHQNALFNGLLPPPEVGGELVFDHKMPPPPPPKVVFIASWFSLMTYSSFFSLGNRKYTAKDISGENIVFLRAWVSSPTNKVSTSYLEPHQQLFH